MINIHYLLYKQLITSNLADKQVIFSHCMFDSTSYLHMDTFQRHFTPIPSCKYSTRCITYTPKLMGSWLSLWQTEIKYIITKSL